MKNALTVAIAFGLSAHLALFGKVCVRDYGAKGDGRTDDTAAFLKAIDALGPRGGQVEVPAGEYLVGELHLKPGVLLQGEPGFGFRRYSEGSTLKLRPDSTSRALIDLAGAYGAGVRDLALVGSRGFTEDITSDAKPAGAGDGRIVHGVALLKADYGKEEDYPIVDHCLIRDFTGDGVHLHCVWCANVRNSLILANGGDGISIEGYDIFICNNEIGGNGGCGIRGVKYLNSAGTITSNRIEWNRKGGIFIDNGSHYCINANYLDRNGTAGVILDRANHITFTGNQSYRSGRPEWVRKEMPYSAHAILRRCRGVTFSSNNMVIGRDDGGRGFYSPRSGIVLENLIDCTVIGNTGHESVLETFLDDRGTNVNSVVRDNVGSVASKQTLSR